MRIGELPMIGEVKDEYIKIRRSGKSRKDTEEQLKEEYHMELTVGIEDDGLLFWVGLADGQYTCKELTTEVAEQALIAIEKIRQTDWEVCEGDLKRRIDHYAAAPMPERAKIREPRKFRCNWKNGDTFAYRLAGPEAEKYELDGAYMIFRTVDEKESWDGAFLPIVTLSLWRDNELPNSKEQLLTIPPLKISTNRRGCPENLFEYRVAVVIKSQRKLDNLSLIYLGNYPDIATPRDEYVQRSSMDMMWVQQHRFLEDCLIFCRRDSAYSQQKTG